MTIGVQRLKHAFALTCVISLFLCCCTGYLLYLKLQSYQNLKHEYSKISGNLYHLTTESDWIQANRSYYQKYQSIGLVEQSDSIIWIDFLASIGKKLEINNFQFELSPVVAASGPGGMSTEQVEISIRGSLLHDGILMQLCALLAEQASGAWFFKSFEVARKIRSVEAQLVEKERVVSGGALDVTLTLVWIGFMSPGMDGVVI